MRIRSNFINKVTLNIVKKRGKNEKYYRNGFVDGVQIIIGCVEE